MAIRVIVELQARPGRRDELRSMIESVVATYGPSMRGYLGGELNEVLGDPDVLVEIADWESAEARDALMEDPAAMDAMAPLSNCWPPRSGPSSSAGSRSRNRRRGGSGFGIGRARPAPEMPGVPTVTGAGPPDRVHERHSDRLGTEWHAWLGYRDNRRRPDGPSGLRDEP